MPNVLRHRKRGSWKRNTWPRTSIDRLETIPESPRIPQQPQAGPATYASASPPESEICGSLSEGTYRFEIEEEHTGHRSQQAQIIWYSQHLQELQIDRERLTSKIKDLDVACKSQSKANLALLKDVRSWQTNCEAIEAELVDAAQEIEEAKAYVRSIETANANLRYALSQVKEEQENAHRKKWRNRAARCLETCKQLSNALVTSIRPHRDSKSYRDVGSRPATRAGIKTLAVDSSASKLTLARSRLCSRISGCRFDERPPTPHREASARAEKG